MDERIQEMAVALAEWVLRNVKDAPYTVKEYADQIANAWRDDFPVQERLET